MRFRHPTKAAMKGGRLNGQETITIPRDVIGTVTVAAQY
jgi:hypothetical protein